MRAYIIRRLLLVIPTIFIITLTIFFLMRLVPGDIVDEIVMAAMESTDIADVDEEALRAHFGLDVSAIVQFGRFWGVVPQGDGEYAGLLQGNLGVSWRARLPVREMIAIKLPVTFELGIVSFILAQLIAIPMGVLSALRQNTLADYFVRSFAILAISIPSFWFATVVVVFGGLWFGYLPPIRWIPFFDNPIKNLGVAAGIAGKFFSPSTE